MRGKISKKKTKKRSTPNTVLTLAGLQPTTTPGNKVDVIYTFLSDSFFFGPPWCLWSHRGTALKNDVCKYEQHICEKRQICRRCHRRATAKYGMPCHVPRVSNRIDMYFGHEIRYFSKWTFTIALFFWGGGGRTKGEVKFLLISFSIDDFTYGIKRLHETC